jgi:RNA polymerase sigma-70 factor (ECF subfamily)
LSQKIFDHYTDQELLDRYRNEQDNKWLEVLLPRYTLLVFGLCMKYLKNEADAKDAVQQVCIKVIAEIPKYKIDYFKSWLYMVAKNHCLMELRKKKPYIKELTHNDIGADELIERAEFLQKNHEIEMMHLAVAKLNDEQRICIQAFYLQKKSYQDIAEETKYSIGEVKSYIQNGKRNLKIIMEKQQKNERK